MNTAASRAVVPSMNDITVPPHEFIGRADTLRPPPPSPWLAAPTHDGLWWVRDGADVCLRELQRAYTKDGVTTWWTKTMAVGDDGDYMELPIKWKFAPAIPPEAP